MTSGEEAHHARSFSRTRAWYSSCTGGTRLQKFRMTSLSAPPDSRPEEGGQSLDLVDRAEVLDERLEAVHRPAVLGALARHLFKRPRRAHRRGDRALACCPGALFVVVFERHWRQCLFHMPDDLVAEHAQEDVRPHLVGEAAVDGVDI